MPATCGNLSWEFCPLHVVRIARTSYFGVTKFGGQLPTAALSHTLINLRLSANEHVGAVDLTTLPTEYD